MTAPLLRLGEKTIMLGCQVFIKKCESRETQALIYQTEHFYIPADETGGECTDSTPVVRFRVTLKKRNPRIS